MRQTREIVPALGLVATIGFSAYMVTVMHAQAADVQGDFRNTTLAEIRDQEGSAVLRGEFSMMEEDDDDVERKATLQSTGVDTDARGEAEIEFASDNPIEQEIEFSAENLAPGTSFTFVLDGRAVGRAVADQRGRVELELRVPLPRS